ncbi:MAG: hypothetical protein FWF78_10820 [Defluviitaleaceae bacterium]|nr:hypothetical protein [Defluviitaleaceae bacterium]
MATKIMIIGFGSTGKYVLDMATKMNVFKDCTFIVVSRTSEEEVEKRINITRISSGIFDYFPRISYHECDINNLVQMSELLSNEAPDIIAYTGRYMKGFKYGEFSYPNEIGYGAWTPMAVVLVEKLMKAVKQSGISTRVINTSFGDAVSPALATVGLAPYTSAGNLNHLIPRIKMAYANITNENYDDIDATFVGAHYANTYISKEGIPKGSPYLLNISGKLKKTVSDDEIFKHCAIPTISGAERNWMIASDVVMLLRLMTDKSRAKLKTHAPGPFGLPGGYPLLFENGEMHVDEIHFSIDDMKKVNHGSLACDGIEDINANGIVFTDDVIYKMKKVFGVDYPKSISVNDCEMFSVKIADTLKGAGRVSK